MPSTRYATLVPLLLLLLAGGCSTPIRGPQDARVERDGAPEPRIDPHLIPDAVPRVEPLSRTGNAPYQVFGRRYTVMKEARGYHERGVASWYGTKFDGRTTSSGEPYDVWGMTAAHRHLPLPTYARVTNLDNGRSVIVKVNDRGPFYGDRLIDLSYAAAAKLGIAAQGTGRVEVRAIVPGEAPAPRPAPNLARAPEPPKPAPRRVAEPGLFLQVGAFSSKDGADRLRSQLQPHLERGVRIQPSAEVRPLYRVQVGPLDHPGQAEPLSRQLAQLGIRNTRLVTD